MLCQQTEGRWQPRESPNRSRPWSSWFWAPAWELLQILKPTEARQPGVVLSCSRWQPESWEQPLPAPFNLHCHSCTLTPTIQ